MKLIVESKTPCAVRVNGEWGGSCGSACRVFPAEGRYAAVECIPYCSERYGQFCARIDLTCPQNTDCGYLELISWNRDCLTVVLCPPRVLPRRPLAPLCQMEFGEAVYTLCDDGSIYLLHECGNGMTVLPIDCEAERGEMSLTVVEGVSYVCVSAFGKAEQYFGVFEAGERCVPAFEGIGDSFRFEEGNVYCRRTLHDMADCRVESVWRIEGGAGRFRSQRTLDYRRNFADRLPARLIPFAFLEGVMQQTETANLFLDAELAEAFSAEVAAEYFGEFTAIRQSPLYPNEPEVVALCYGESGCMREVKHYRFRLQGRKICNIEEV